MLLDDLGDYLSTQGVGALGTTLFKALLPDTPDECIALFESGGHAPTHTMGSAPGVGVLERPTIQIICRSTRYDSARDLARQVDLILNGARNITVNGILYAWITAQSPPSQIGRDENNRHEVSCNYAIARAVATSS